MAPGNRSRHGDGRNSRACARPRVTPRGASMSARGLGKQALQGRCRGFAIGQRRALDASRRPRSTSRKPHAGVTYDPTAGLRAANVAGSETFAVLQRRDFVIDRELGKRSGDEQKLHIRCRTSHQGPCETATQQRNSDPRNCHSVDAPMFVPFGEAAAKPVGSDCRQIEQVDDVATIPARRESSVIKELRTVPIIRLLQAPCDGRFLSDAGHAVRHTRHPAAAGDIRRSRRRPGSA